MTYTASIETDAGSYQHGFHLGTDERVAREVCQGFAGLFPPKIGTRVITVGLKLEGKLVDVWDGSEWESDREWEDD